MKLSQLLQVLPESRAVSLQADPVIKGIVYDPLRVEPGFLFVAINIYTQLDKVELPDGHLFVRQAIEAGASAVILNRDMPLPAGVGKIVVPDSRLALALLSDRFYGSPSRAFKLLGITGTNGKTTTTHIVENIFNQRYRFGLIGTLYYKIDGQIFYSKDTTPEPPDLQEIFMRMKSAQLGYCIMEVSSHGIDFSRIAGLEFAGGIFSNLSQDHLDYHKTMENYRNTKLRFFRDLPKNSLAYVNIDDDNGELFQRETEAEVISYGLRHSADVSAENISYRLDATEFTLGLPSARIPVVSPLIGEFNVYNSLAAAAVALGEGLTAADIAAGLQKPLLVAGRLEPVDCGQPFAVIVDYAHSPESMRSILQMASALEPKRIITVFGCGGDRDPGKRPQMGAIAERYSDLSIVTSDNPRNEDPGKIVQQIISAMTKGKHMAVIDRREAIEKAISLARKGDMLLILGKGHETTQVIGSQNLPFDDRLVAKMALQNVGYRL